MNIKRPSLDASRFKYAQPAAENAFIGILRGFIRLYEFVRRSGKTFKNNEVIIRDEIFQYLQDVRVTNRIEPFMYYRVNKEVDENNGRLDLKIERLMPYTDPKAYFSIECKRIDGKKPNGKSGLNAKYVKEGINRYKQQKYTAYYKVNGMFGFVVDDMNIEENVKSINLFLKEGEHLSKKQIDKCFDECYFSSHAVKNGGKLSLYHLMFDFHDNVL